MNYYEDFCEKCKDESYSNDKLIQIAEEYLHEYKGIITTLKLSVLNIINGYCFTETNKVSYETNLKELLMDMTDDEFIKMLLNVISDIDYSILGYFVKCIEEKEIHKMVFRKLTKND